MKKTALVFSLLIFINCTTKTSGVKEYLDQNPEGTVIAPIYPGCEDYQIQEYRDCFQNKIQEHISKNFTYPEIAQEMGIQGTVFVSFTIDRAGDIIEITTRGPDKNLEKEANRIISKLPKMTAGRDKYGVVIVPFSIPIIFKLN